MSAATVYTLEQVEEIAQRAAAKAIESVSHFENRYMSVLHRESEERMSINKAKIRRPILLNGVRVWVSGDSEQEYADNLLKMAGCQLKTASATKHIFKEYATNWFEVFSKPNITDVTALTYERQLRNHIFPVLGDMILEEITVSDVQKVFNRMGEDAKQETKNKVKIVLGQIFKMAYEERIINRNPMQSMSLKVKGQVSDVTQPYTVEQMQHLASHLKDISNPTSRAWLAISISLPLRPEEVLGLKWEDLDEKNHIIRIRNTVTHPTRNEPYFKTYTKTASSKRDLQLPAEIMAYLPERGDPDDFIIGGKEPISYTKLRGMRKWITKETGFGETITPRRFRTTVATDISAMTHDLKLVQKMLGHSNPQMTLKYYDKGRSQAVDATEAISKCYGFAAN